MKRTSKILALALATALGLSLAKAKAGFFTFLTSSGTPAEADLTTSAGQVTLTLKNLIVNPTSVGQNISAFNFALDGNTGSASIVSILSTSRNIAGGGTFTNGLAGNISGAGHLNDWVLSSVNASILRIDVLGGSGHAGPAETIVGAPNASNVYSNANGSIAGNGPHNDFLGQTATWVFNVANVTANSKITGVAFQFGTTDGTTDNMITTTQVPPVPLPAAAWSGLALLGGLGVTRKVRKHLQK